MAKLDYFNGITSVILRVFIQDTSVTTGAGKTGLTKDSSGLLISTIADNESTATAYSGSNLETITTLGTFAAPSSGKCRFKEVDSTNHPGVYEIQIANARWAVSNARSVIVSVTGASGAAAVHAEVQLKATDLNTDVTTALANLTTLIARLVHTSVPSATVQTGSNSASTFKTDRTETVDDYWKDAWVQITSGVLAGQVKKCSAYNGTTKYITVQGGYTGTPADGVTMEFINR